jgi:thiamine-phosphate pyrophosphorylase
MVTDRRRAGTEWRSEIPKRVEAAARAGVDLVQVRERDLDGGVLFTLVRDCVDAVAGTPARVVVNERVDVALAAGAHGVHLRGDSFAASRVRALSGPRFVIGRSVHSAEEAAAVSGQGGLDYLLFGTVFETASKAGRAAAGVERLRDAAAATSLPVLAIGGITLDRMEAAAAAGAAGIAAIGLFAGCQPTEMVSLTMNVRVAFDSPRARSLT